MCQTGRPGQDIQDRMSHPGRPVWDIICPILILSLRTLYTGAVGPRGTAGPRGTEGPMGEPGPPGDEGKSNSAHYYHHYINPSQTEGDKGCAGTCSI